MYVVVTSNLCRFLNMALPMSKYDSCDDLLQFLVLCMSFLTVKFDKNCRSEFSW